MPLLIITLLSTMNFCLKHLFAIFEKVRTFHDRLTGQTQVSKDSSDQIIPQTISSSQLKGLYLIDEEHDLFADVEADKSVISQPLKMIVVKKQREKEYDQEIDNQSKKVRSYFYNQAIQQKLKQAKIIQKYRKQIFQLFIQGKEQKWLKGQKVQLAQKGNGKVYHPSAELRQYKKQIKQLFQQLRLINSQCQRRQKETPAITQITQLKLTSLKVIDIRYSLYIYTDYRYQVSAFTLFKAVHENRGLSSVTLKGIYVSKFKQFLRANAQSKLNQIQEQKNEELRWIKDFRPSKSLKIAIDVLGNFQLTNKKEDFCAIRDLTLFGPMFEQFSVISVNIQLQEWKQLTTVTNTWQQFWKLIKMIGKMKTNVTLKGYYCQPFTVLLHMISFLTISQLQFINIQINSYIGINRFLAMQQILRTIFERKTLTSLKLYSCRNFPILPSLSTLQSIQFRNTSFWRPLNIVNELMRIWPSIISIRGYSPYRSIPYIEEKPFSQLQNLQIQDDSILDYINISVFSTHSTLNIESYSISESCVQPSVLFPQLKNITQLVLSIHIDHKQICVIPSPHLAKLRIIDNYLFVNQGLEAIDKKWPKLRQLYLRTCPRLNESGWSACEFKGLITLQVDPSILALGHHFRQQFRGRGIKVDW